MLEFLELLSLPKKKKQQKAGYFRRAESLFNPRIPLHLSVPQIQESSPVLFGENGISRS